MSHKFSDALIKENLGNKIIDIWLQQKGILFRNATTLEQWKGIDRVVTSNKHGGTR